MSARAPILPRLMRATEAAAYLGMGVTKFRELVKQGRIAPPSEDDGLIRWDRADLDDYADGLRPRPEPVTTPRPVRAI